MRRPLYYRFSPAYLADHPQALHDWGLPALAVPAVSVPAMLDCTEYAQRLLLHGQAGILPVKGSVTLHNSVRQATYRCLPSDIVYVRVEDIGNRLLDEHLGTKCIEALWQAHYPGETDGICTILCGNRFERQQPAPSLWLPTLHHCSTGNRRA